MELRHTDERFGSITFDLEDRYIEDELDRDAIWAEAGHDYGVQQRIYMDIAFGLFEEHPDFEDLFEDLVSQIRDFGAAIQLPDTGEWLYLEAGDEPAHIV